MKKLLKILALLLVAAFAISQFFRPDRTNLPVVEAETLQASMQVPEEVDAIFSRSCNDCHSNKTEYPWYSDVAPVSWWLADHVSDGRRHLNFSVWNTYQDKKKAKKLEEICEQVESGEMPLPSYLWIHRYAILKEGEAQTICTWANAERSKIKAAEQPSN
jgi:hypothetical protein